MSFIHYKIKEVQQYETLLNDIHDARQMLGAYVEYVEQLKKDGKLLRDDDLNPTLQAQAVNIRERLRKYITTD